MLTKIYSWKQEQAFHNKIKKVSKNRGISMAAWLVEAVSEKFAREEKGCLYNCEKCKHMREVSQH